MIDLNKPQWRLEVLVTDVSHYMDSRGSKGIPDIEITIIDINNDTLQKVRTDTAGKVDVKLTEGQYEIFVSSDSGYVGKSQFVNLYSKNERIILIVKKHDNLAYINAK